MKRKIISIDAEKCNGCGICVKACHEGAIEMIDGKAQLVSDKYCDGLGDCLPTCPTGAINMIEREADEFDEVAVKERTNSKTSSDDSIEPSLPCGCPGTMSRSIKGSLEKVEEISNKVGTTQATRVSELRQWPVQLKLVNSSADYFQDANLLVAADCTAYAYADFHNDFIKDHVTVIGCPKLDDLGYYQEKLADILSKNNIKSITVVRMEVPCCNGIVVAVKEAMLKTRTIVPYREVTITIDGKVK
ncbi:MAG: ferredoxin [Firmicutes bacterium HGW-Firmicutes-12]|nr:MAG: ferredoxin [Firmicutes bacterium HGW-Firmicutes-12]